MLIDGKGKVFGKISIFDLVIIILIIGLAFTFMYRNSNKTTSALIPSGQEFDIVLKLVEVADYGIEALEIGDVLYEQHAQAIGEITNIETEQATRLISRNDGTVSEAIVEGAYTVFVTVKCTGNINPSGYFIGGNRQVSAGETILIQSKNIVCESWVYYIIE